MKIKIHFLLIGIIYLFSSCQDETYVRYTANSPVYMSYDDLRSAVKTIETQPLTNPGKIYFKDNYLFINEYMKGVHVYNNEDPANPLPVAFIDIPGNIDIAIRNNFLFADSYVDLVVIDISDLQNPKEVDRKEDIFPYTIPEFDEDYEVAQVDQEKGVVLKWEIKEVRELIKHNNSYPIYWDYRFETMGDVAFNKTGGGSSAGGGSQFGVGGSMARFGQYEEFLLVLKNSWEVSTFEVEDDGDVNESGSWNVGWNIETMFIRETTMFIGSQSGMFIYDISRLPNMEQLSQFMHFTACDPVIADEKYAYITLKTGGACGRGQNVLEVVDVSELRKPFRVKTYQMKNPNGLGLDGDFLFICDGTDGLKVFDATRPDKELPLLSQFKDIHAYDVIPLGTVLFMIGDDGFYQYDYTDIKNIRLLSKIGVVAEDTKKD